MTANLEAVIDQIDKGALDQAEKALGAVKENDTKNLYAHGFLHERRYEYEEAIDLYEKSLAIDENQPEVLFRAALTADMLGDEEFAIDYYERCISHKPVRVSALLNLAILYEESGSLSQAETNLRHVLEEHPAHFRAQHFMDSVESSYSMMIDERSQRESEQRSAVLDVPISDFELSVRSRNCLRQMNIRSLGDLLKVSEAELLSYKNFGETSLNEIKALLNQKGLRMGQAAQRPPETPTRSASLTPQPGDGSIYLSKPVSELELSVRSRKCLQRLGVQSLGELVVRTETELMSIKNFGQTSLNEIKRQLALFGLSFRTSR